MNVSAISRPSPEPSAMRSIPVPGRASASPLSLGALRHAPLAEQRAAVGGQFEAILIRQLLGKTMTSMLGGESGPAGGIYGDLLTEAMATQLSAGRGLGLGRLLETQLAPPGETPAGASTLSPHP